MLHFLSIIQLVLSVLLVASILLQQRGSGLSSTFGGSGTYYARRGAEKVLFRTTIVLSILFLSSAVLHFVLS